MPENIPRLVVRDAAGSEREVEVSATPFTLGRQADSDLVLLDNRISRRHARIVRDAKGYILEDAESRHGTYVNGEKIDRCLLKNGDRVGLGVIDTYQLTFQVEEAALANLLEEIEKAPESPAPRLQHLNLLLQLAQLLDRATALDEILVALLDSALQLFDADRGSLFLIGEKGDPELRLARTRSGPCPPGEIADYSAEVVRKVIETRREEVVLEDLAGGAAAYETVMVSSGQRGILAIPLQKLPVRELSGETLREIAPELLGVLYLENQSHAATISSLDRQALRTLAMEGAMIIENSRLLRVAREQERSRHEMALAQSIQQSLLPRSLPRTAHFRIHSLTTACRTVGGDYYDFVQLPEERFGLVVGDVSGKGLPAAMMAMTLQGAFSALAAANPPLPELFHRINLFLSERTPPEMYATLFYGVLGPDGCFEFVNAGHAPPMIARSGGAMEDLSSSGFPVGMFKDATFEVAVTQLAPGDVVLVYSDGLTEAQNEAMELLGEERVAQVLQLCASSGAAPEEVCTSLLRAVASFVGSAPQTDDVTIAVLQFESPGSE
jgi:phosphoserine phosphatase RsbU/P